MKYFVTIADREWTFNYSETDGKITDKNNAPIDYRFEALGNGRYLLILNGQAHIAYLKKNEEGYLVLMQGEEIEAKISDEHSKLIKELAHESGQEAGEQVIKAPIPGLVTQVLVEEGATLKKNSPLLTLEAMKMENVIKAPGDCVVEKIHVKPGETVQQGQPLVELLREG